MLTGHKISGVKFVLLDGKSFFTDHYLCQRGVVVVLVFLLVQ